MSEEMIVGGCGMPLKPYQLSEQSKESIFQPATPEIARELGIEERFARFIDQYTAEKLAVDPGYAGEAREKCAISIVNFLGLPDVMGKSEYLDLRDPSVVELIHQELEAADRDTGHAINLYKRRGQAFYENIVTHLDVDQREKFHDELDIYREELREREVIILEIMGAAALASR